MSDGTMAGSPAAVEPQVVPSATTTDAAPRPAVPWGYRWRLYILFMSQLPAAVLGWALGLAEGTWHQPAFDPVRGWVAVGVAFLGLCLRVWGAAHLSVKTMASTRAEGDDFVCSGPYRICRNPLYAGSLLQCFAFGLQLSWVFALLFTAAHFWRYGAIVRYEEAQLRVSAPGPFANYCTKVSRWLPNLFSRDVWHGPFFTWPAVAGNSLFVGLFVGTVVCALTGKPQLFGLVEVLFAVPMIWFHRPRKGMVAETSTP